MKAPTLFEFVLDLILQFDKLKNEWGIKPSFLRLLLVRPAKVLKIRRSLLFSLQEESMLRILTTVSVFTLTYVIPVFAESPTKPFKATSLIPSLWAIIKLLWPLILLGIIGLIFKEYMEHKIAKRNKANQIPINSYLVKTSFLSPAEKHFYQKLNQIINNNFVIFSHVKMAELLYSNSKEFKPENHMQHIDFILCNPQDFSIKLGIELDDSSHNNEKAKQRDEFKNQIFKQINVPLLRILYTPGYSPNKLKLEIERELKIKL